MELQQNLDLIFDVDAVLRRQGADAPLLHARRPALVKMVGQALQESIQAGVAVHFTPGYLMIPQKSLTMVLGISADMKSSAKTCDFCSVCETCCYQDHYPNQG
jgi:hypothetical protein